MINFDRSIKRHGFTLTELLVSMIIVATLAGLAIPRFTIHLERARAGEALQLLESLHKAQFAYFYENGAYTSTLGDLEINIPTTQSYNAPVVALVDPIVSLQRNNGDYTVGINIDGSYTCVGAICTNIGF